MIDYLTNIESTVFLLVYILFSAIIIIVAKYYIDRDSSFLLEVPEPTSISPVDTAILTKGIKGAIITTLFNLWSRKLITISRVGKSTYIKKVPDIHCELNQLENAIINFLKTPKLYRHFFNNNSIQSITNHIQANILKLQELKLIADNKIIKRSWILFIFANILMLSLGFTKIYLDIISDKPIIFLVICMLLSVFIMFYIIKPTKIYNTALGRKFIKKSTQRFEWLKKEHKMHILIADDNLSYLVALFGANSLIHNIFSKHYKYPKEIASALDYGCGGEGFNEESCSNTGGCADGGCSGGCGNCGDD